MDDRILRLLKEARQQLEFERERRTSPVAIVGIGCRFPGGASNPAALWDLLRGGVDTARDIPADRWDKESFYDADPDKLGKAYTMRGSFLDRIDGFDPEFFAISPREAKAMDPQQRLLLEVVWEALEDAGIVPARLRGSATGVWVGLCSEDYARRSLLSGDPSVIDAYNALGNTRSVAAGRISYAFDLRGPAVQLDTACSSSLVAIHQACQSLRLGECDLALVGGVNLMCAPETTIALCKLRALSPDGRCKTFDAAADGYGRGEGCGIVVLKRLADARSAGDRIYATVRGSAVNHDGQSNGLTAPSGPAQEAVLRTALDNAGVSPRDVGYVEAHGTGTLLGDPIEVLALSRVYGENRAADAPLYLGAVKTNFGHLESAAGVAGLIKLALGLSHGELSPHLHLRRLNPKIPWPDLPVRVVTESMAWPRSGKTRIGGVSSFGMSGTNAHVIVEEAPAFEEPQSAPGRSMEMLVLTAKAPRALDTAVRQLREHVETHPNLALGDLAYSLVATRSSFEHRLVLKVKNRVELLEALLATERGVSTASVLRGQARDQRGRLAWLFTGQGAQLLGMGRGLHAEWPAFRDALDNASSVIDPLLERPLREVMWALPGTPEAALLDQTGYTQPALFAFEWALAALWRSFGISPDVVIGHSIGEITAACVAGVFSLEDGARLVCARARLMQALPSGGAMISIAAPEADVAVAVGPFARTVSVAAINSPSSTVLAGVEVDVQSIADRFSARGVQTKRLSVSHAFHSPLMEPMLAAFLDVAQTLTYRKTTIPLVSNISGQLAGDEVMTPNYWVGHVRSAVRFADGARALHRAGAQTFLELGPKATLLGLVSASVLDDNALLLPSLRSGQPEPPALLEALGGWVVHGGAVDWRGVFPLGGRRVPLPTYSWQRQRHWIDATPAANDARGRIEDALARLGDAKTLSTGAQAALPEILEALAGEHVSESFYNLNWKRLDGLPDVATSGRWLLVVFDDPASADTLSRGLSSAGATVEKTKLTELATATAADHVVCVWEDLGTAQTALRVASEGLAVIRALAKNGMSTRLWWVTRGAVSIENDRATALGLSTVWGLGRSAMQEHAELNCTLLDVEHDAPLAPLLCREAAAADMETQVAWRSGQRYGLRLVRAPQAVPRMVWPLRGAGTVLITGGLGGLGLEVARAMARRGVQHLLLTSRHGAATPGAREAIAVLEAMGSRATVLSADVTDRLALSKAIQALPREFPLRGVIHTAGVLDDGLLVSQTSERFAHVMGPKVLGAWNLHELTATADLDIFVLFSSVAGAFGSAAQGGYSAANAFLDSLAEYRRGQGLPGLSLAWGPWAGRGMAAALDSAMQARLSRQGLDQLEPAQGIRLFEAALQRGDAHLLVALLNLPQLGKTIGSSRPSFWRELLQLEPIGPRIAELLSGMPLADRQSYLQTWMADQCGTILGMQDGARLLRNRGFFDLGMDSLMMEEFRRCLERGLGRRISASVLFSHPNIESLVEHLLQQSAPASAESSSALHSVGPAANETELAPLESDEDAIRFINARFETEEEDEDEDERVG